MWISERIIKNIVMTCKLYICLRGKIYKVDRIAPNVGQLKAFLIIHKLFTNSFHLKASVSYEAFIT